MFLLLLLSLLLHAPDLHAGPRPGLEQRLQAQYEGKAILLRGFPTGDLLHYDAAGHPLHAPQGGSWTMDGVVLIESVGLAGERLHLEGRRLAVRFDPSRGRLVYVSRDVPLRLEVETPAEAGLNEVESALSRIILLGEQELIEQAPEHWRFFLRTYKNQLPWAPEPAPRFTPDGRPLLVTREQVPPPARRPPPEALPDGTRVLPVTGRIWPPRRLYAPLPAYPEAAQREQARGSVFLLLVVDQEGRPQNIRVDRPFGYGLEEAAVAAVREWRFAPATLDGNPVAVETRTEVSFR